MYKYMFRPKNDPPTGTVLTLFFAGLGYMAQNKVPESNFQPAVFRFYISFPEGRCVSSIRGYLHVPAVSFRGCISIEWIWVSLQNELPTKDSAKCLMCVQESTRYFFDRNVFAKSSNLKK